MTTFTLRLPDDLGDALRQTAEREGASMNEIAIKAVALYTSGRVRRRDEHLAAIVREDARLLARLGDVEQDDDIRIRIDDSDGDGDGAWTISNPAGQQARR